MHKEAAAAAERTFRSQKIHSRPFHHHLRLENYQEEETRPLAFLLPPHLEQAEVVLGSYCPFVAHRRVHPYLGSLYRTCLMELDCLGGSVHFAYLRLRSYCWVLGRDADAAELRNDHIARHSDRSPPNLTL